MALVVMGLSACVEPQNYSDITKVVGDGRLSVNPTVSEATVVTRAASDADLMEKQLNTLDVFVEHVTDGVGDGTIMRQYHLPLPSDYPFPTDLPATAKTIGHQVQSFLKEYWTKEGLRYGEKYNIYVAVNNTQTRKDAIVNAESLTVATLKGLIANEVTDGLAVVDDANNIAWPGDKDDQGHYIWDSPSGNIYKQYVSEANSAAVKVDGTLYGFTTSKEFMMDGVLKNWTPVAGSKNQVFGKTGENDPNDALILNRAAAKIVLNLKFDADFLHSLTHNKKTEEGTTTWVEKPASEKLSITGAPAWRFYNFAFGAKVFAPAATEEWEGVEVHNSATLLLHPYDFVISLDSNGVPVSEQQVAAQIITYTYPNKWTDYSTEAPSLVISVPFLQNGQTDPEYHYYRIPLVKNTVTEIKRNHIYVINATIATRGSELHEDVDEIQDVIYEVLPWNDETNSAAIHDEVKAVQHYYFKVNPKVYTLRGDGDQSVVLTYLKAAGTKVNWKLFTYDEDGNQLDVVAKDDEDAIRAWFYNASGEFTTTYNDNEQGVNWSNTGSTPMGVKIEQSTEGTSGSSGTVTVTSHALNNRAIKYIRLRVYLDETATFIDGKESMYEDIIIRHFPMDNIQNIEGSWSSYLPSTGGTQTITVVTRDLDEAEALVAEHGGSYTSQTGTETEYIDYATYTAHSGETGYAMNGPNSTTYNTFHQMVQNQTNRQNANSQANAVADGGEGHNYYWGTNPTIVSENNRRRYYGEYDYRLVNHEGMIYTYYDYYKYSNYYYASYTHTTTYTEYTVTYTTEVESNWVDWERDGGHSYSANNRKYTRASIFTAKIYDNNRNHIYAIEPYQSGNSYTYRIAQSYEAQGYYTYSEGGQYGTVRSSMRNLTNNHMYVIQISSTSEGYIMGRPILGKPNANLSQDDVVSPAFMIASQLGAVQTTDNSTTAAEHCRRYMEVTPEGKRYTGWRLPTPDEISVITRYQNGTINGVTISNSSYQAMSPVLTGGYYWSLTGNSVSTGLDDDGPYLRCVRDLSAKEVEELNGFQAIIDKYSNQ